MSDALLPPLALHGWYMLTQFVTLVPSDHGASDDDRTARLRGLADLLAGWSDLGDDGWSGLYGMVGGGSDYMLLHLRPDLDGLGEAERALRRHPSIHDVAVTGDYLSVVELGLYGHTLGLARRAEEEGVEPGTEAWQERVNELLADQVGRDYTRHRLYPRQPDAMPYVCFYPMNKRRNPGQNWYTRSLAERARLMQEHGRTGRSWAGKVSQIISGSVGLDDWEWAVTLFSGDPIHFKELVTQMRYDEVTSVYGEFGPFVVGRRVATDELAAELTG
ncbi:chlorite dismutase family protein [Gaopeijia maritima]|uniref:Chlorite dismutase family protein n=1 Tax=Gaopeijia maritima TaxID=3119007 RepID=A0ABU9E7E6_9BACT